MNKAIIVTGTPGTGKSTFSKKLAKEENLIYLDVNKVIDKLDFKFDKKRDCKIVDIKKLNKEIIKLIKDSEKTLVIDSHLSHYIQNKYIKKCFVCKCDIKILRNRLKKRKYSKDKIEENIEAEIMDVCLNEAKENKHKIEIINTSKS